MIENAMKSFSLVTWATVSGLAGVGAGALVYASQLSAAQASSTAAIIGKVTVAKFSVPVVLTALAGAVVVGGLLWAGAEAYSKLSESEKEATREGFRDGAC